MTNTIDKATLLGQILAWGNCRATCAMDTHSAWAEVVKSLDAIDALRRDHDVAWLLVDQQKDRLEELETIVAALKGDLTQRTADLMLVTAELSANYVQPVPDHCDRITWRNRYYHLPLAAELAAARAQEPLTDATKASCALGYEECSHRCGTPHVCCDHYVAPEPIATPTPPVREPLSDNAILGIYNKVGQEDGAPYRFAGAIEAAIKEQGE